MAKILIIGANSAIAEAAARLWASRGESLYLLSNDAQRLSALAADLGVRGAKVSGHAVFDANDFQHHAAVLDDAVLSLGGLDTVLIAYGTLTDQPRAQLEVAYALSELSTNALSVISLCTLLANAFEAQGHGSLAVISSVAGERGRQSNYVYGTAKGALTLFLQGLRNRLAPKGVHVLTIKPGFVDTPMTSAFKKGPLWASASTVGRGIVAAIDKKRDVAYLPGFWALIMAVIRAIPEPIFKKMKL